MTNRSRWTAALTAFLISVAAFCTCGTRVQEEIRRVKLVCEQSPVGWAANLRIWPTRDATCVASAYASHHDLGEFHGFDRAAAPDVPSGITQVPEASSDDAHL